MAFENATVTVSQDGRTLPDVYVVVGDMQSRTDGSGVARFDSLPEGPQDIVIVAGADKYVFQTSIQSSEIAISLSAATSATQNQIQPQGINLLAIGEQSITILGVALLVLVVLGGLAFIIFFKKNTEAYQRQLKKLGMLAVLGTVAGVSALIYSQTNMLTNTTQANRFTQSTRADTRREIPKPSNLQVSISGTTAEFEWEMIQVGTPIAVSGYNIEWVPQSQKGNLEVTKNKVVKETRASLTDLEVGLVYEAKVSTIDSSGNLSEPSEFIFYIPGNDAGGSPVN